MARSEIAMHAESPAVAAEWAAKAVEVTSSTRGRKYEAIARAHLSRALVRLGRTEDGLVELRAAVALADALVNPVGRWQARASLADALRARGDEDAAAATTLEAREILEGFAATLAPGRAATLLAAPQVRAVRDPRAEPAAGEPTLRARRLHSRCALQGQVVHYPGMGSRAVV